MPSAEHFYPNGYLFRKKPFSNDLCHCSLLLGQNLTSEISNWVLAFCTQGEQSHTGGGPGRSCPSPRDCTHGCAIHQHWIGRRDEWSGWSKSSVPWYVWTHPSAAAASDFSDCLLPLLLLFSLFLLLIGRMFLGTKSKCYELLLSWYNICNLIRLWRKDLWKIRSLDRANFAASTLLQNEHFCLC